MQCSLRCPQALLDKTRAFDFIAPLAIRLYLVPIFWFAGLNKLMHIENVSVWFGEGLGLPLPTLMAYLAGLAEFVGAICLLLGFAVRWMAIPLIITMLVAIFAVHWDFGWAAIASSNSEAAIRLSGFLEWLQATYPERYEFITALGTPVMLQNGIEYGVTYLIMLFVLFFGGAGKYVSADYWIARKYCQ